MAALDNNLHLSERAYLPFQSFPNTIDELIVRLAFSTMRNCSSSKFGFEELEPRGTVKTIFSLIREGDTGLQLVNNDPERIAFQEVLKKAALEKIKKTILSAILSLWPGLVRKINKECMEIIEDVKLDFAAKCFALTEIKIHKHSPGNHVLHTLIDNRASCFKRREIEDLISTLAEFHLQVDMRDVRDQTPLLRVAALFEAELSQALIAAGANPNVRDSSGCTPLFYATVYPFIQSIDSDRYQPVEITKLLIESRADVNERDASGQTLLDSLENIPPNICQRVKDVMIQYGARKGKELGTPDRS